MSQTNKLNHYLAAWALSNPQLLTQTMTSQIYTVDCANTLCNPVMPELVHNERRLLTTAAILADMLTLERWRVLAFTYAYACLDASWWLQLGGSDIVQWALKVAAIIEPLLA